MAGYKLVDVSQGAKISHLHDRLFFRKGDECCASLPVHIDFMKENEILEMDVYLAERVMDCEYFFCRHFQEVGEGGNCGIGCNAYSPRNGKNGACKHFGFMYEQTERKFKIVIK